MILARKFFGPLDPATGKVPCLFDSCKSKKTPHCLNLRKNDACNLIRHLEKPHHLKKADSKHVSVPSDIQLPVDLLCLLDEDDTPPPTKKQKKPHHPRTLDANGDTPMTPVSPPPPPPPSRSTHSTQAPMDTYHPSHSDSDSDDDLDLLDPSHRQKTSPKRRFEDIEPALDSDSDRSRPPTPEFSMADLGMEDNGNDRLPPPAKRQKTPEVVANRPACGDCESTFHPHQQPVSLSPSPPHTPLPPLSPDSQRACKRTQSEVHAEELLRALTAAADADLNSCAVTRPHRPVYCYDYKPIPYFKFERMSEGGYAPLPWNADETGVSKDNRENAISVLIDSSTKMFCYHVDICITATGKSESYTLMLAENKETFVKAVTDRNNPWVFMDHASLVDHLIRPDMNPNYTGKIVHLPTHKILLAALHALVGDTHARAKKVVRMHSEGPMVDTCSISLAERIGRKDDSGVKEMAEMTTVQKNHYVIRQYLQQDYSEKLPAGKFASYFGLLMAECKVDEEVREWACGLHTVHKVVDETLLVMHNNYSHTILPAYIELWKTLDLLCRQEGHESVRENAKLVLHELQYYCGEAIDHSLYITAMLLDPRQKNRASCGTIVTTLVRAVYSECGGRYGYTEEGARRQALDYAADEKAMEIGGNAFDYWEQYGKKRFPLLGAIADVFLVRM